METSSILSKYSIVIFMLSLAQNTFTKNNHCKLSNCISCTKKGNSYSCNSCAYSSRKIVDEKLGLFTCKGKMKIKNCVRYMVKEDGASDESQCLECKFGWRPSENS